MLHRDRPCELSHPQMGNFSPPTIPLFAGGWGRWCCDPTVDYIALMCFTMRLWGYDWLLSCLFLTIGGSSV